MLYEAEVSDGMCKDPDMQVQNGEGSSGFGSDFTSDRETNVTCSEADAEKTSDEWAEILLNQVEFGL